MEEELKRILQQSNQKLPDPNKCKHNTLRVPIIKEKSIFGGSLKYDPYWIVEYEKINLTNGKSIWQYKDIVNGRVILATKDEYNYLKILIYDNYNTR